MYLITKRTLEKFAVEHADSRTVLADLAGKIGVATWTSGDDLKKAFPSEAVRTLGQDRAIFDIKGNKYRLIVSIQWADPARKFGGIVRVEFIGTHGEYNRINATTVTYRKPKAESPP